MKSMTAKKFIVISLVAGFITGSIPASAFTKLVKGSQGLGRASVNDLAYQEVAILPGNPLFFVKGWGENIRGFFIGGEVSEAQFQLEIAGSRAGELRKLLDWAADNESVLSIALVQYRDSLEAFETKLSGLTTEDLGDDAQETLSDMTIRLFTQVRFIDDIRSGFTATADQEVVADIEKLLISALAYIGTELDTPEAFAARIATASTQQADAATAVRAAVILGQLADKVRETSSDLAASLIIARSTIIFELAAALAAEQNTANIVMAKASTFGEAIPSIAEIIDQLADEALKAELGL